jgi:hypothetical protein
MCGIPQDEGNSDVAAPLREGLFCYLFPGIVCTLQFKHEDSVEEEE